MYVYNIMHYIYILTRCILITPYTTLSTHHTFLRFRNPKNLFMCPTTTSPHSNNIKDNVTFYGVWLKVIHVCFLQAAGTAIGKCELIKCTLHNDYVV